MRYAECDGLDVLGTYRTASRPAVDGTRNARPDQLEAWRLASANRSRPTTATARTPGPAFINVKTYRYQGHSMSDPQKYRSKEEVGEKQEVDCINRLVNWLIEHDKASQDQIDQLDHDAKEASKAAIKFAEESPDMPIEELYTDVYVNVFGPYKKGRSAPRLPVNPTMANRGHKFCDSPAFAATVVFGLMFGFTALGTAWYWFVLQPAMIEQKLAERDSHGVSD